MGTLRGFWFIQTPMNSCKSACANGEDRDVQKAIRELLNRIHSAAKYLKHPLLIPLLFLESRLQLAEQSHIDGFSGATYQTYAILMERIQKSIGTRTVADIEIDISKITAGIHDAHYRLTTRSHEIADINIMMGAIVKGFALVEDEGTLPERDSAVHECLKSRVDFFAERISALETRIRLLVDDVHITDTMVRVPFAEILSMGPNKIN